MWLKFLALLVGIFAIALSFYFEKKMDDRRNSKDNSKNDDEDDSIKSDVFDFEEFRQKLLDNDKKQDLYDKESIQDDVNRMVTKKMVEFNEFSEHLLEKIVKNHKEVMFLYDMLSKKEKEIKDLFEKDYSEKIKQLSKEKENDYKYKENDYNYNNNEYEHKDYEYKDYEHKAVMKNQAYKINEEINDMIYDEAYEINHDEITNSDNINDNSVINEAFEFEEKDSISAQTKNDDEVNVLGDMYSEIVNMKKQGMNNIDISKELQLGTGEVNLILNLYKSKIV